MKRLNQGLMFLLIAAGLTTILLFKSKLLRNKDSVSLRERLPVSDILIRMKIIELCKDLSPIFYKHNLPIREFVSADFILSQGKQYGINIQSEAYMFANVDMTEWGIMVALNDSSKVIQLVDRFRKNTQISDSSTNNTRILYFKEKNVSFCYEKKYALLYSGNHLKKRLGRIRGAVKGKIAGAWKRFFQEPKYGSGTFVAYSEGAFLEPWGVNRILLSSQNDSTEMHLSGLFKTTEAHGVKFRNNSLGLPLSTSDSKAIELHLDSTFIHQKFIQKLTSNLHAYGKKIGFPTSLFLKSWDGNLSFREGGTVHSIEKIVVTEFDENFNPKETVRQQKISVPGYSVMMGVNPSVKSLLTALYTKGILRNEENKLRFLYAPLLTMKMEKSRCRFSSSSVFPDLVPSSDNFVRWTIKNQPCTIELKEYGSDYFHINMHLPSKMLVKELQKLDRKKK